MESPPETPQPPPLPAPERRAALWCWPLILLSVFFIGWSVNLFAPEAKPAVAEEENASLAPATAALMKLEAQIVIGSTSLSPGQVGQALKGVRKQVRSDPMASAYLLLAAFVAGKDGELPEVEEIESLFSEEGGELLELTRIAMEQGVSPEDRARLAERVGWFSQLAADESTGEIPDRSTIVVDSMLVVAVTGGVFTGAVFSILAGAVLLFLFLRKIRLGERMTAFDPHATPRGVLLEVFALYLGVMALGELLSVFGWLTVPAVIYLLAIVLPLLWPFVRGVAWKDFLRSMGWHRGKGVFREVGAGFVGYAGVLAIASIGIFGTILLTLVVEQVQAFGAEAASGGGEGSGKPKPAGPVTHPIVGWIYEGGAKERVLAFLLAAGFAPLVEELFFRGALHRYLRGHLRFFLSALVTGLIFAALHPQGWMGIPALAAIGIGFSLLREWRDSLIAPMVAHAINNGVIVGLLCLAL